MSRLVPIETAQAFKNSVNIAVDFYGIDVDLYMLMNADAIQDLDVYSSVEDRQYQKMHVKCRMEWINDIYKLRKLGLYNEKYLPIVAWFRSDIDIPLHSYFVVPVAYMPNNQIDTDKFEIVDDGIEGLADIEILRAYKVAPKRDQTPN